MHGPVRIATDPIPNADFRSAVRGSAHVPRLPVSTPPCRMTAGRPASELAAPDTAYFSSAPPRGNVFYGWFREYLRFGGGKCTKPCTSPLRASGRCELPVLQRQCRNFRKTDGRKINRFDKPGQSPTCSGDTEAGNGRKKFNVFAEPKATRACPKIAEAGKRQPTVCGCLIVK